VTRGAAPSAFGVGRCSVLCLIRTRSAPRCQNFFCTPIHTRHARARARTERGTVPERDARKLLGDLRKQRAELVAKIAPTKSRYDSAQATLKDPAAKRDALLARFPALRR
jgi:hypothetical protein